MTTNQVVETIEGLVAKVNANGVMLDGAASWLNISKYASPAPVLPAEGDAVRIGLDKGGFIRTIEVTEGAPTFEPGPTGTTGAPDRDIRIMRQAVLNTATAILSSGGRQVELPDVIEAAAELERWVLR